MYEVYVNIDRYDTDGWDKVVIFKGSEEGEAAVYNALDNLLVAMGFTEYAIQHENPNFVKADGSVRGVEINVSRVGDG
jgi:hypothetical protein